MGNSFNVICQDGPRKGREYCWPRVVLETLAREFQISYPYFDRDTGQSYYVASIYKVYAAWGSGGLLAFHVRDIGLPVRCPNCSWREWGGFKLAQHLEVCGKGGPL